MQEFNEYTIDDLGKLVIEPGDDAGAWLVLERADRDKHGHKCWLCRCLHCGTERAVREQVLEAATKVGCGCERKPPVRQRLDLAGQQLGPWVVLGDAPDALTGQRQVRVRDERNQEESVIRLDKLRAKVKRMEKVSR